MPDPAGIEAIRAAVEAIVPPLGELPGAADLGVHDHVVRSLELFVPGFADLLATLLEAYAADVRPGVAFAQLSLDERRQVLRAMAKEDAPDMRDVIDGLFVLTYGGVYSEWTGYDRATRRLVAPKAWAALGFGGPSDGHPSYREGT